MAETPDKIERVMAAACCHCGTDVSTQTQRCRHRYDHIDLPPIRPIVTRVELYGGRCRGCGKRYRAEAPAGMAPGTPFGPGIRSIIRHRTRPIHGIDQNVSVNRALWTLAEGMARLKAA